MNIKRYRRYRKLLRSLRRRWVKTDAHNVAERNRLYPLITNAIDQIVKIIYP